MFIQKNKASCCSYCTKIHKASIDYPTFDFVDHPFGSISNAAWDCLSQNSKRLTELARKKK
jgi:hypothetical protein